MLRLNLGDTLILVANGPSYTPQAGQEDKGLTLILLFPIDAEILAFPPTLQNNMGLEGWLSS